MTDDEKRAALRAGTPVSFPPRPAEESADDRATRTIDAQWIEDLVETTSSRVIRVPIAITNAIITGPLDLQYVIFEREIVFVGCHVLDDVTFEYATFKHVGRFEDCTFGARLSMRAALAQCDLVLSRSVFSQDLSLQDVRVQQILAGSDITCHCDARFDRIETTKDMHFTRARFRAAAYFPGLRVGGQLVFDSAEFAGVVYFPNGRIQSNAVFRGAQFAADATFEGIEVRSLFFSPNDLGVPVRFHSHSRFLLARVVGQADFRGTQFKGPAFFDAMSTETGIFFGSDVPNQAAVFDAEARFPSVVIHGQSFFKNVTFTGEVFFHGAQLVGEAFFHGAQFGGRAGFDRVRMESDSSFGPHNGNPVVFADECRFPGSHFVGRTDFKQVVFRGPAFFADTRAGRGIDFRAACFERKAVFVGMQVDGPTSFGIDTNGTPVTFREEANFAGMRGKQTADFHGAQFRGPAFFQNSAFESDLLFEGTRFHGEAVFEGLATTGSVAFSPADGNAVCFDGPARFSLAHIRGQANFSGAQFAQEASFDAVQIEKGAGFGPDAYGHPVHFRDEISFAAGRIQGDAIFRSAQFTRKASFHDTEIGGKAIFIAALFGDEAHFDRTRMRSVYFGPDDSGAGVRFVGVARFPNVDFNGQADFERAEFLSSAFFFSAHFHAEVGFRGARFGGLASFERMTAENGVFFQPDHDGRAVAFAGEARFAGGRFHSVADFNSAEFRAKTSFQGAHFDADASFNGCTFYAEADFSDVHGSAGAYFKDCSFSHRTLFSDSHFRGLFFRDDLNASPGEDTWPDACHLDLRGLTYERLGASWRNLLRRLDPYDRQPYAQLETVLRGMAHDADADDVYLERRHRERRSLRARRHPKYIADSLYCLVARYGVRPYRLAFYGAAVLLLGTFVFAGPGAVMNRDAKLRPFDPPRLSCVDAAAVSFHQFFPIRVPVGSTWKPTGKPITLEIGCWKTGMPLPVTVYATAHQLAGWLLVPLGVAALTGVLNRRPKV